MGKTISAETIAGATRGEDHIKSISVIAIVGTVRNTAMKGAANFRTAGNTAPAEATAAASTVAASHDIAVRASVKPNACQNSEDTISAPISLTVSVKEGIT